VTVNLDYSRVEVARLPRFARDDNPIKVKVVRSACPKGKESGSPPSLPRPSHPPQWALDGEEPSPHFSIRSDVSLITEIEILAGLRKKWKNHEKIS